MEKVGRRPLILFTMLLGALANILLVIGIGLSPIAAALAAVLIKVCHDGGSAPVAFVLPSEICPQASRSTTVTVSWTMHWLFSIIAVAAFPSLRLLVGNYIFLVFAAGCLIFAVWFWFYFPETSQRRLESIVTKLVKDTNHNDLVAVHVDDEKTPLIRKA